MALILDGNGLIQGLSAGGLPDGSIDADSLASTLDLSSKTMTFGNVTASGITFPASVSASSNPNTLDDYEEGTWTPAVARSVTNPTVTYAYQTGSYTKVGRMVYAQFDLNIASISANGSGDNTITGLPFTVLSGQTTEGGFSVAQWRDCNAFAAGPTATTTLKGFLASTYIQPQYDNIGNAGSGGNANISANYSTGRITGFVIYQVA